MSDDAAREKLDLPRSGEGCPGCGLPRSPADAHESRGSLHAERGVMPMRLVSAFGQGEVLRRRLDLRAEGAVLDELELELRGEALIHALIEAVTHEARRRPDPLRCSRDSNR